MITKKRAFISFDFDYDVSLRNLLSGQAKLPDSPFEFYDWSVKEPFPQRSWQSDVRTKIRSCHFMIIIIGLYTHQCSGVLKEIEIAIEEGIPCIGIFVTGKNYYVPKGLKHWYTWTWPNLKQIINAI